MGSAINGVVTRTELNTEFGAEPIYYRPHYHFSERRAHQAPTLLKGAKGAEWEMAKANCLGAKMEL